MSWRLCDYFVTVGSEGETIRQPVDAAGLGGLLLCPERSLSHPAHMATARRITLAAGATAAGFVQHR
jgi:hypothetical protein